LPTWRVAKVEFLNFGGGWKLEGVKLFYTGEHLKSSIRVIGQFYGKQEK